MRFRAIVLSIMMAFPSFSFAKLAKTADLKQLTVHGFLKKEDDKAVIVQGRKKYTLPWIKFVRLNNVAADPENREAKYILPFDKDLKIELEPVDKDQK